MLRATAGLPSRHDGGPGGAASATKNHSMKMPPPVATAPLLQGRAILALAGTTIFLGAFLLFQVQPIMGKAVLPRFGGSAAVWTTCMLFFQGMLLAGYLYAHASVSLLAPAWQRRLHVVLLAATVFTLPILPVPDLQSAGGIDPNLAIFLTLMASVGLPYFLLSTTGPLLQAWITQLWPGAVPWRLFALSNLASLLALLTYPVAIEPFVSVRLQGWLWSGGFVLFAIVCAAMASIPAAAPAAATAAAAPRSPRPGWATWAAWLLLAACPSVLLLAVTNHLTQDIAPIPFLWIVPLVLYLLSFILCFEQRSYYRRAVFLPLAAAGLVAMDVLLAGSHEAQTKVRVLAPLLCAALFACCMACHGELARAKPAPDRLTAFYLAVAAGGVLGGALVGLVAPRVFNDFHELPLALVATAACLAWVVLRDRPGAARRAWGVALLVALVAVPVVLGWRVTDRLVEHARASGYVARNFFGAIRVRDDGPPGSVYRTLVHGGTDHGGQHAAGPARTPTSYYSPMSGIGQAIIDRSSTGPVRVGVIGLGTGTLAAYSRPGDAYVFYDINPLVVDVAKTRFAYLSDAAGAVEVVLGDARVSLEKESPRAFDVLAVDAFSGDSVPVHLLTAEAFGVYLRHLKPSGIVAVHISNHYLDLHPVVHAAAAHHGRDAVLVENERDAARQVNASSWVLIGRRGDPLLQALRTTPAAAAAARPARLWTDDYSSVLTVVRALRRPGG
jgi:SAM-dependent methyltransferase